MAETEVQGREEEETHSSSLSSRPLPFHRLLSYADAVDWALMGLGSVGAVVHGMAQPIGYLLLGKALEAFGSNVDDQTAMVTALKKECSVREEHTRMHTHLVTAQIYMVAEISCWMHTSERQVARLRLAFLRAVLHQDIEAFDTELTTAKVMAGATHHMSTIQDAIGEKLGHFISCFSTYFAGVVIAIVCCWEVALLSLMVLPMILAIGATYTRKMDSLSALRMAYLSEATSVVEQVSSVSVCKAVFSTNIELLLNSASADLIPYQDRLLFRWRELLVEVLHSEREAAIFNQAKAAGSEIFKVIERKPRISYETKGEKLEKIVGGIEINGVSFAYPSRQDKLVLQGFSLSIPAGKVFALVGEISIDGHSIKDLDLKFLRRNVAAVPQEPSLFSGTIKDNLKVGNLEATDEEILKAASAANADSFISLLPDKYSTWVGERQVQLSGGQKQRIAIARAVLKDSPILLLDEPTSALDTESEKVVQEALGKVMQGRTVIIVAHRASTVINADTIVVVEEGRVAQSGSHGDLLASSTFYKNLFRMHDMNPETQSRNTTPEIIQHTPAYEEVEEPKNQPSDPPIGRMQTSKSGTANFSRIWFRMNKFELAKTALGSLAAAVAGISKPLFGFFIMTIGVAYYEQDARETVGKYSIIFCIVGVLALVAHTLQHYHYGVVGEKAMGNLREALFSAVLRNEVAWFEKPENGVGLLATRIVSDTSVIKTIISDRMSVIVQCISSILIATTVSMIVNWRMGLVAWALMPCHFIGGLIQSKSAKGFSGDSALAHQQLAVLASESASNIRTVAAFVHEEQMITKAKLSLEGPLRIGRLQSIKYGMIQGTSLFLWNVAHAVALWYTTILVDKNQSSFEDGIRSYQIFSLTVPSITELWTLIPTVVSAISILKPAFDILDRETRILPDVPDEVESERIVGRIEFEGIRFSYPSRPEVVVLDSFVLTVEAGSSVALVGPSGAGKSSVLALLMRFYDPARGRILIDGKDMREYNLRCPAFPQGLKGF
ncbi:hypothetical protein BHE74_00010458 [Ensete ventricosum]|nr:hypothetical protein BHE74_00010458 [Ensete ventricosum]